MSSPSWTGASAAPVTASGQGLDVAPHRPVTIDSLTGIRGIAAAWVFLTHYQAVLAGFLQRPAIADNTFLYNGFRGVDLFFVLSGFILMHVHAQEFRAVRGETVRRFYMLRFFRVFPLNTAVLLVLVPITLALPGLVDWFRWSHGEPIPYHNHDFSAAGFVQSLLLAQTWTVVKLGEWNGPAWSLSAEVLAYAFFPLLAAILVRQRSALLCVSAALVSLATLMVLLVLGHHTQDSPTGTFGLIRCVFGFVAGACMARVFQLRVDGAGDAGGKAAPLLAWMSLAFIAVSIAIPLLNMFAVFGFCGLIYALAFRRGAVNAMVSSGAAMFLGRISFSLYMIHYVPLKMSLWLLDTRLAEASLSVRAVCVACIPLLCVALALLAYRTVELPFQRHARNVLRRRSASRMQAALAS